MKRWICKLLFFSFFLAISQLAIFASDDDVEDYAPKSKADLAYNELKGRVKSVSEISYGGTYKIIYTFDSKGRKIRMEWGTGSAGNITPSNKTAFKYNANGKKSESKYKCIDSNKSTRTLYFYDKNGKLEKTETKDDWGKITFEQSYSYDNKGRLKETRQGPNLHYVNFYDYEGKNHSKTTVRIDVTTTRSKSKYVYDSQGRTIQYQLFDGKGNFKKKVEYKYNKKGDRIAIRYYEENGKLKLEQKIQYKYDSKGNWISQAIVSEFGDGKESRTKTRTRKITYFRHR